MKFLDVIFLPILASLAYYLFQMQWERNGSEYLYHVATSTEYRPFVSRLLLPLFARGLHALTTINVSTCLLILFYASVILLYFALKYLYRSFRQDHYPGIFAFFVQVVIFSLSILNSKVYDMPTAFFFVLMLACLARKQWKWYLILFPLATLNRETTILFIAFYFVLSLRSMTYAGWVYGLVYQIFSYAAVWIITRFMFADYPGSTLVWRLQENIEAYRMYYQETLFIGCLLLLVGVRIWTRWKSHDNFIQTAFLCLFPAQVALHLAFGYPFETRVFIESIPVILFLL